jgi:hypothetical protein
MKSLSVIPAPAPLSNADSHRLGLELTELYHEALEGHMRVLSFGAKFLEVESYVSTCGQVSGGRGNKGGVAEWMRVNAPEISRPTAYRFRDIAAGMAKKFGIKNPALVFCTPLKSLPAADRKKRDKVLEFTADKSLRGLQLELGLLLNRPKLGGARPRGGDAAPVVVDPEKLHAQAREELAAWHEQGRQLLLTENICSRLQAEEIRAFNRSLDAMLTQWRRGIKKLIQAD